MSSMTDRLLKKVVDRSYDFSACQDDLELARCIHDGTYVNTKPGDPNFHAYAAALNIAGVFALQALDILELIPFNNTLADLQENYMPSYPPMSPVTSSFFQAWMVLDARIPSHGPTLGGLFAQYLKGRNALRYLWKTLDALNDSYGSFYEVVGPGGNRVQLWDIAGEKEICCWNSSAYSGEAGEVWYVRVLPSFLDACDYSVTLNTPYVFRNEGRRSWADFFRRHRYSGNGSAGELQSYLKHGKFLEYWMEFVFQAYCNHTGNAIFLSGLPDNTASRPHSALGRKL